MSGIILNFAENMSSFEFEDKKDLAPFFGSLQDESNYFYNKIKKYFNVVDGNILYYYNSQTKLWKKINKSQFHTYCFNYFNNSIVKVKQIRNKEDDDVCLKKLNQIIIKFGSDTKYINEIVTRCYTNLISEDFMPLINANHNVLPIKNGKKIDLRTLKISDRTPDDIFTEECEVEYLTGETPNADKFFKQLQPDEDKREYVRKILGYNLSGWMFLRCFFIWWGYGSNGKSLLFNILQKILKSQSIQCDKSIFMKGKEKASGGASPELMQMMGVRNGCFSEGESSDNIDMNMGGIKRVTGEDWISGRPLYGPVVQFLPFIKLNLLTNFVPRIPGGEKAVKERTHFIFMKASFVENPDKNKKNEFKKDSDFADKLLNEYLSEMFSWMVKGAKTVYETKTLEKPKDFIEETDVVFNQEDSIKSFMKDGFTKVKNDNAYVKKCDIFIAFQKYCDCNSLRCQPRSSLFNRLDQEGIFISPKKLDGYDIYRGLVIYDNFKGGNKNDVVVTSENNKTDYVDEIKLLKATIAEQQIVIATQNTNLEQYELKKIPKKEPKAKKEPVAKKEPKVKKEPIAKKEPKVKKTVVKTESKVKKSPIIVDSDSEDEAIVIQSAKDVKKAIAKQQSTKFNSKNINKNANLPMCKRNAQDSDSSDNDSESNSDYDSDY